MDLNRRPATNRNPLKTVTKARWRLSGIVKVVRRCRSVGESQVADGTAPGYSWIESQRTRNSRRWRIHRRQQPVEVRIPQAAKSGFSSRRLSVGKPMTSLRSVQFGL